MQYEPIGADGDGLGTSCPDGQSGGDRIAGALGDPCSVLHPGSVSSRVAGADTD